MMLFWILLFFNGFFVARCGIGQKYNYLDVCNQEINMPVSASVQISLGTGGADCRACDITLNQRSVDTNIYAVLHNHSYYAGGPYAEILDWGDRSDLMGLRFKVCFSMSPKLSIRCPGFYQPRPAGSPSPYVTMTEVTHGDTTRSEDGTVICPGTKERYFRCSHSGKVYCIPKETVCNGVIDCPERWNNSMSDLYDESQESCNLTNNDDDGFWSNNGGIYVLIGSIFLAGFLLAIGCIIYRRNRRYHARQNKYTDNSTAAGAHPYTIQQPHASQLTQHNTQYATYQPHQSIPIQLHPQAQYPPPELPPPQSSHATPVPSAPQFPTPSAPPQLSIPDEPPPRYSDVVGGNT